MAKILIVDDSNMLRDMVKFSLEEGGYREVSEAIDGQEALYKAKNEVFDLIITDINMPNMDGFELIAELRKMPVYAKVPIMTLTTEKTDEMKAKGRAAGATGWLVKPFIPEQLLKAVGMVLNR